ncbi:KPN_02809 family neutral zinc metallopeptidase [Pseudoclavibacter soli]|uniref:KPN_02809 family neutral zinc metallopeptidase n=1 Tax=Pseudoclavibacter soli TaxID=452623 RepID=UPI0004043D05|nr:neutral zinc metallopeptidase [Pseudoclavibacter soli]
MTFNNNANIESDDVQKRRGGGRTAMIGGGGVLGLIVVALVSQFLGVDVSGVVGGLTGDSNTSTTSTDLSADLDKCKTGADANSDDECRMQGAAKSLNVYWSGQLSDYAKPGFVLVDGETSTPCGTASNAVGPFYCPSDQTIYIDTSFWQVLRRDFDATAGPLAQMYVLAHEWGHHVQNETGAFAAHQSRETGAASDSVRLELQADCYAGAWVAAASTTTDENGVALLQQPTTDQITDALNAASAVGDDHIQQQSGVTTNSESWTHGSSAQRQKWFNAGYAGGPQRCDTFSVSAGQL